MISRRDWTSSVRFLTGNGLERLSAEPQMSNKSTQTSKMANLPLSTSLTESLTWITWWIEFTSQLLMRRSTSRCTRPATSPSSLSTKSTMIWFSLSLSRSSKFWSNLATTLASQLQEFRTRIAKSRNMTVWLSVVSWRDYWARFQSESKDKEWWFKISTRKCQTYICSWDKDAVLRMHSRFHLTSRRRRLRMILRQSRSAFSLASWTTMSSVNLRKRRPSIRTRCHRESWTCSNVRLPRRWWQLRRAQRLHHKIWI